MFPSPQVVSEKRGNDHGGKSPMAPPWHRLYEDAGWWGSSGVVPRELHCIGGSHVLDYIHAIIPSMSFARVQMSPRALILLFIEIRTQTLPLIRLALWLEDEPYALDRGLNGPMTLLPWQRSFKHAETIACSDAYFKLNERVIFARVVLRLQHGFVMEGSKTSSSVRREALQKQRRRKKGCLPCFWCMVPT
ncbi:hypothetical protein AB1N83_009654 [Pleurotus pulmonarius]